MIGRLRPGHDPERDAAAFLAGEQRSRARRRFEAHLMECEDCWEEVRLGRAGRAVAEVARELAPPHLREGVRAAVSMSAPRRRVAIRQAAGVLVLLVLASIALGVSLFARNQPQAIAEALAAFRSGDIPADPAAVRPAPDLSQEGLTLLGSGETDLGTQPAEIFAYRTADGGRVFLYLTAGAFPEARGATERTDSIRGWVAEDDGVSMVCAESPVSFLLMGTDARLLDLVEDAVVHDQLASAG